MYGHALYVRTERSEELTDMVTGQLDVRSSKVLTITLLAEECVLK